MLAFDQVELYQMGPNDFKIRYFFLVNNFEYTYNATIH